MEAEVVEGANTKDKDEDEEAAGDVHTHHNK